MLAHTGCQGRGVTGVIQGGQRFGERLQCRLERSSYQEGAQCWGLGELWVCAEFQAEKGCLAPLGCELSSAGPRLVCFSHSVSNTVPDMSAGAQETVSH